MADRLLEGKWAAWMEASHLQCWWICGLRLFLWSRSRLGSLCRFKRLQETLLTLKQLHVCVSPLLSQMKNNFCWWNGHVARTSIQNYRLPNLLLVWALNSFLQTFTRLNLLLENSCSTLFPTEPQSFWRFIIFCTNCFSLYGRALNLEAKQSRHLPKQTIISNPGTTSNLTTQHRSTGVREDVAPWKLF